MEYEFCEESLIVVVAGAIWYLSYVIKKLPRKKSPNFNAKWLIMTDLSIYVAGIAAPPNPSMRAATNAFYYRSIRRKE